MDIKTSPARFGLVVVVIVALTTTDAQEITNENLLRATMAAHAITIVSGQ
jgi:hypothetical protein